MNPCNTNGQVLHSVTRRPSLTRGRGVVASSTWWLAASAASYCGLHTGIKCVQFAIPDSRDRQRVRSTFFGLHLKIAGSACSGRPLQSTSALSRALALQAISPVAVDGDRCKFLIRQRLWKGITPGTTFQQLYCAREKRSAPCLLSACC